MDQITNISVVKEMFVPSTIGWKETPQAVVLREFRVLTGNFGPRRTLGNPERTAEFMFKASSPTRSESFTVIYLYQ